MTTTNPARPVIAYVRVSTSAQATEGVSLEAQRERAAAWATVAGLELAAVHVDAGLSGSRADNRPALQQALAQVCEEGGVLVVYSLSRLARSTKDTIAIAEQLDHAGADLVSLSESIDTTTAAGKMVFRMMAVLAEFERDLVSERTVAAMELKRSRNEYTGGRVPFGYRLAEDGQHIELEPAEQAIVEQIVALRERGLSYRKIAGELEARGCFPRDGRAWSPKVLRDICGRAA